MPRAFKRMHGLDLDAACWASPVPASIFPFPGKPQVRRGVSLDVKKLSSRHSSCEKRASATAQCFTFASEA